ncbi:MAG: hypothetical protein PHT33_06005, partial [bacterium]|nr:hypothetical protein [bacterium]
ESAQATETQLPKKTITCQPSWVSETIVADDFATLSFELRHAIEKLVRQLAVAASVGFGGGRMALSRTIRTLAQNGILPWELANALADLVPVLNRGVHGEQVSPETLEWLVLAGRDTIEALSRYVDGYTSQATELEAAILEYASEGIASNIGFRVSEIRWVRDNKGVWWATAMVEAVDRELEQALVIMRRDPGGNWIGVNFGTGLDEDELPKEVRRLLWRC